MPHQPMRPSSRRRATAESLEGRLLMDTTYYRNPLSINLYDDFDPPTPAFVYPSVINVDPLPGGPITELRVTLFGVYHDQPMDMDVLVVNPAGRSVVVMSDAGGTTPIPGDPTTELTFIDTATRSLPESAPITPGIYRPTNYSQAGENEYFPFADPSEEPTDTTLAALAAGNPAGAWTLYVVDDTIGNVGGILYGWGLTFVTGGPGPAAPSTPDMQASSDRGVSSTDNITNVDTPRFTGTGTPGTRVRLFVNGVPNGNPVTVSAAGAYSVQAQAIPAGTHNISVRSLDAQGTEGPASGELTVTIDTVPPDAPAPPDLTAASDTGASSTDDDTDDATPTFTGDAPGATTVQLLANGLVVGTAPVSGGSYSVTPTNALAAGTYDFTVITSDPAGNNSLSDPMRVIIRPGGTTSPAVSAVYVRGSAWAGPDNNAGTTTFKEYLEEKGLGDDVYGFRVDNAPADTVLPWINLNQVVVRYTSAPTGSSIPTTGTLTLSGQRSGYTITSIAPLPGDATAFVLTLDKPLGGGDGVSTAPAAATNGDRVTLGVAGGGPGGSNFSLRMNVLQGDVSHAQETTHAVLANDYAEVKNRFFKTTRTATGTTADYTAFHDVDGNGSILANDYAEVKKRFFHTLPAPTAAAAGVTFGAERVADGLLSERP